MHVIKIKYGDIHRQTDLANNRVSSALVYEYEIKVGGIVKVSGYRYVGTGFDPRRYQIF